MSLGAGGRSGDDSHALAVPCRGDDAASTRRGGRRLKDPVARTKGEGGRYRSHGNTRISGCGIDSWLM